MHSFVIASRKLKPVLLPFRHLQITVAVLCRCHCCMLVGVKSLLAGNQQAAVTVAVEGLMDAKANAEADSFISFDPKVCWQRLQHFRQPET